MKTADQHNASIFDLGRFMEEAVSSTAKAEAGKPYKAALQQILAAYRLSKERAPEQKLWTPLEAALYNAQRIVEAEDAR